ncbi:MAG: hypothetical protein WAW02_10265 [Sideroxyarcus sp.]
MGASGQTLSKTNSEKVANTAKKGLMRADKGGSTEASMKVRQSAGNQALIRSQNVDSVKPENMPTITERQYQLFPETELALSRDTHVIVNEIQAVIQIEYVLILSLISKWAGHDRELPASIGTPHLDKLFQLLETQRVNIGGWRTAFQDMEQKALDRLIHLMDGTTLRRDQLRSYLKESNAYREYAAGPNITALWQWEKMLADELHSDVEHGSYDIIQLKLNQVGTTDRDDVSVALLEQLQDKELHAIAKSKNGQALLTRLYDELSSGNYSQDEMRQAVRVRSAKNAVLTTDKGDIEEGYLRKDIKVFPYRKTGMTVGMFGPGAAVISARRSNRQGYIRVSVSARILENHFNYGSYKEEYESLPHEVYESFMAENGGGIDIPENEIVKVIQYDEGGVALYCSAFHLIEISNEHVTHTFQKIGEVAGLALMLGPGAAAEGGVEAVTFAAKAAQFLKIADKVAAGIGAVTSVLIENRGWIIRMKYGKQAVDIIEMINGAVMMYGFVRMATEMPRLVMNLKNARQNLQKAAREKEISAQLSEKEMSAVSNLDQGCGSLEESIKRVRAANDNVELPTGSTVESTGASLAKVLSTEGRIGTAGADPRLSRLKPGQQPVANLPIPRSEPIPPQPPLAPAARVPITEELQATGTGGGSFLKPGQSEPPKASVASSNKPYVVDAAKGAGSRNKPQIVPTKPTTYSKGSASKPIRSMGGGNGKPMPAVGRLVDTLPERFPIPVRGLNNYEPNELLDFFRVRRNEYPPDIRKMLDDIPSGLAKTPLRDRLNALDRAIRDKHTAEANLLMGKGHLPEPERPFATSQRANANEGSELSSLLTDQKQLSLTGRLKGGGVAEFDSVAFQGRVIKETKLSLFRGGKKGQQLIPVEDVRDQMMRQSNFAKDWGFRVEWNVLDFESALQADRALANLRYFHPDLAELIRVNHFQ